MLKEKRKQKMMRKQTERLLLALGQRLVHRVVEINSLLITLQPKLFLLCLFQETKMADPVCSNSTVRLLIKVHMSFKIVRHTHMHMHRDHKHTYIYTHILKCREH